MALQINPTSLVHREFFSLFRKKTAGSPKNEKNDGRFEACRAGKLALLLLSEWQINDLNRQLRKMIRGEVCLQKR